MPVGQQYVSDQQADDEAHGNSEITAAVLGFSRRRHPRSPAKVEAPESPVTQTQGTLQVVSHRSQ